MSMLRVVVELLIVAVTCMSGCSAPSQQANRYETIQSDLARNTLAAQQSNLQGLKAVEKHEWETAEAAFREALEADLFYPSAHNNLGLVLLQQGRVYEAAWEFKYAAKLMPNSAEPRHNLGLLMERVGRLEDAADLYDEALAINPDNVEVMGHLARVYIKSDRHDAKLRNILEKLVYRSEDKEWDQWARRWLIRLDD